MTKRLKDKPALLFSLPNLLTYARIIAVPLVVLCFFIEGKLQSSDFARWSALGIFVVASVTDFFDGYLARIWGQTSNIGRMLDPIADKLLVAGSILALASTRTDTTLFLLPALMILMREFLVAGLREFLADKTVIVPVSLMAKWKTAIQLVAIAILIGAPLAANSVQIDTIGLALFWVSALMTVKTGYDYFKAAMPHLKS